jgi:ferritin-like metal-binding protein YciE
MAQKMHSKSAKEPQSLDAVLYKELQDIYDAEKQLVKALPKMVKAASSEELQEALEEHLRVTEGQVERLEQVFERLGRPAKANTCEGMKGLIAEGKEAMEEKASQPFGDIAIIAAAQKVEHYEIASYGTARALAEMTDDADVADLLQQSLDEEKEADEKLTEVTQNLLSEFPGEEEEEEMETEDEEPEMDTIRTRRRAS